MPDPNHAIIAEFRANGGRVGGMFEGAPLLLITTQGARSGRAHTTPVGCHREDDQWLIFGTNAGRPRNPDWYHNLLQHPEATIEVGEQGEVVTHHVRAVILDEPERSDAYAAQVERAPEFGGYQEQAKRPIPVVALHLIGTGPGTAPTVA